MTAVLNSAAFTPSRAEGLARLARFLPSSGRPYSEKRNADHGPDNRSNVSTLSPYLRHRLVTDQEVLAAVLARAPLQASEKFVQELFWRSYFKGHLETRPAIWARYRADLDRLIGAMAGDTNLARRYHAAVEGRTGIDAFDAWARELATFGYLHNHTRMWFASIWIFTLKLPWQLGADLTLRHFIDGDPASNTLSWRWVAGLHTVGRTYLARRDNILRYTDGRFAPEGLAITAPALIEDEVAPVEPLPTVAPPLPGPVLLLLVEDDLHPESIEFGPARIVGVALGSAERDRSPLAVSDRVREFTAGALADARARAESFFAAPARILPDFGADGLIAACADAGVTRIVMPYAPVGPAADRIAAMMPALVRAGLTLNSLRRGLDTAAWPHASRGFFNLRKRIPAILAACGIAERSAETVREPVQARLL